MNQVTDTDVVIVTASRDRWRNGRQFKAQQPVPLLLADLNETELKRLEGDPVLSLRFATTDTETSPDAETGQAAPGTAQHATPDLSAGILKAVLEDLGPEDFNKDGSPNVGALEDKLGRDLSKADVTAALAGLTDEQRDTLKERLKATKGGDAA